jgi:hypothetical protein
MVGLFAALVFALVWAIAGVVINKPGIKAQLVNNRMRRTVEKKEEW